MSGVRVYVTVFNQGQYIHEFNRIPCIGEKIMLKNNANQPFRFIVEDVLHFDINYLQGGEPQANILVKPSI